MSNKNRVLSLMDEYPLLVYPSLAEAMGINKAVVFQQLHFLLKNQETSKNEYVFIDGRWWVYNTYAEWKETYFSWLATVTLKGIFRQLASDKLIITKQSVKNKSDRRKWYTIDYEVWDKFYLTIGQKISHQPSDKKYPINGQKVSDGYSETSPDTSSHTSTESKRKRSTPHTSNNPTELHPLIAQWAKVRGIDVVNIGAPIHTAKDLTLARKMAKWEVPPSCDEIERAVKQSKATSYPFAWLEADIPKVRLDTQPIKKRADGMSDIPELRGITEIIT